MKNIYLLFLMGIVNFLGAQEINSFAPNIFRASPQAESLGKFGLIPVNLSTGKINYQIQLFEININDLKYPIYLSYNYDGFQPSTTSSMTGLGWSMNVGGAIIRQVHGTFDEESSSGYFNIGKKLENHNYSNLSNDEKVILNSFSANGNYDTSPDNFIINTPTINGGFRLNTEKEPIFNSHRNYKIDQINNNDLRSGMNITDELGYLYKFNIPEINQSWNWSNDHESMFTSAWMLSEIKSPISDDKINLQYIDYSYTDGNYTYQKFVKDYGAYTNTEGWKKSFSDYIVNTKLPSRIDFPSGYILFNYEFLNIQNCIEFPSIGKVACSISKLKNILIYDKKNTPIKKFEFEYFDKGAYFFLKSIKDISSDSKKESVHHFEYLDLNKLPNYKIDNNLVDFWGYYNGKNYYSPEDNNLEPDFNYSKTGALSKITYPTKGYTNINYSSNEVKKSYTNQESTYDTTDFISLKSPINDICEQREKIISIPYTQDARIRLDLDVSKNGSWAQAKLISPLGITLEEITRYNSSTGDNRKVIDKTMQFHPGNYRIYIDVCDEIYGNSEVSATAALHYRSKPFTSIPTFINVDVGGIKVDSTEDCYDNCTTTIYKYVEENENLSSGILSNPYPRFKTSSVNREEYYSTGFTKLPNGKILSTSFTEKDRYRHYTEMYKPIFPLTVNGNHINYSRIEIINQSESNGKKVEYYGIRNPIEITPDLYDELDYMSNKLLKEIILKNTEEELVNQSINEYEYNVNSIYRFNPSNFSMDCIFKRNTERIFINPNSGYSEIEDDLIYFNKYCLERKEFDYLFNKIKQQVFENNSIIEKNTYYKYHTKLGYKKEETTTNSKGETLTTEYQYPSDLTSGYPESTKMTRLVNENRIAEPVIVKQQVGSVYVSEIHNQYNEFNGILQKSAVFQKKGEGIVLSQTTDRKITFHSYDNKGNITQYTPENGLPVSIIWGYNSQYPVAKLEGIIYDDAKNKLGSYLSKLENGILTNDEQKALRLLIPEAMITTYVYKPLVGVTTITGPNGMSEFYKYDEAGRLQEIRNDKQEVLKTFQYNYKN